MLAQMTDHNIGNAIADVMEQNPPLDVNGMHSHTHNENARLQLKYAIPFVRVALCYLDLCKYGHDWNSYSTDMARRASQLLGIEIPNGCMVAALLIAGFTCRAMYYNDAVHVKVIQPKVCSSKDCTILLPAGKLGKYCDNCR